MLCLPIPDFIQTRFADNIKRQACQAPGRDHCSKGDILSSQQFNLGFFFGVIDIVKIWAYILHICFTIPHLIQARTADIIQRETCQAPNRERYSN